MHGHLAARLDPLGSEPVGDPALGTVLREIALRISVELAKLERSGESGPGPPSARAPA